MKNVLFGVLCLLAACGPMPLNQMDVPCAGSTMRCDCVTSCTSDVSAAAGPAERGSVKVEFIDGDGCVPSCR